MRCYASNHPSKPYLSGVGHLDVGVNRQHVTNILKSRAVSLQILVGESTAEKSLHVLGLCLTSPHCSHVVLEHPGRVAHHALVISQLLVAGRAVVVAGNQRIVALTLRNALDSLRVLPIILALRRLQP